MTAISRKEYEVRVPITFQDAAKIADTFTHIAYPAVSSRLVPITWAEFADGAIRVYTNAPDKDNNAFLVVTESEVLRIMSDEHVSIEIYLKNGNSAHIFGRSIKGAGR